MLLLVGAFIFLAGRHELWATQRQEYARRPEPLDAVPAGEAILDVLPVPSEPPSSAPNGNTNGQAWVIWTNGQRVHMFRIQ